MRKGIIKYIIIIAVILIVVFLSQQAYSRGIGKALISAAANQASAYMAEGSSWVMSNIYPKISGEVQNRGAIIQNEVNQEKQKVSENIGTKIENYFSGVANSVLHPGQTTGQTNSCTTQPTQTSTN